MKTIECAVPEARSSISGRIYTLFRRSGLQRVGVLAARALATAFGVLVVTFALVRLIPGDPVDIMMVDLSAPNAAELREEFRKRLGLDGNIVGQLWNYLSGVVRGDLGTSMVTGQPVVDRIKATLPVTLWLIVVSMTLALIISLPLSLLVSMNRGTIIDRAFRVLSSIALATPGFYLGLLLILLVAIRWGLAPVAGYEPGFPGNLYYLWLPALTMCGVLVPVLTRVLAASISETLDEEFVEAAIARGLNRRTLMWRYLMRPSVAPTLSLMSYMLGQMLGASVVVEMVFNIPGIGTALILEGVLPRDYTMIQGIVFVFGIGVVLTSFSADLLSGILDPRVKV